MLHYDTGDFFRKASEGRNQLNWLEVWDKDGRQLRLGVDRDGCGLWEYSYKTGSARQIVGTCLRVMPTTEGAAKRWLRKMWLQRWS